MRPTFVLVLGLALALSAGCLGQPPHQQGPTPEGDSLPTGERGADVPQESVGCADPDGTATETGDTRPGQVGTGTGDIGSPSACPDDEDVDPEGGLRR